MKQVIQNYKTGKLKVSEVPAPLCSGARVLVKNCASLISSGTERSILELEKFDCSKSPLSFCEKLFAAKEGMIKVKNLGHLKSAVAYVIKLLNNSDITFNPNLTSIFIPSGNPEPPVADPTTWQEL